MTNGKELEAVTLERALERLDEIARELDAGELELAESLALFEEGVRLLRVAEGLLSDAQERVLQLRADGEGFGLHPLPERP